MSKEVFEAVREAELETIRRVVYGAYEPYEPSGYIRRYDDGGMNDPNNIIKNVVDSANEIRLEVVNATPPNPLGGTTNKNLPELIEYGHGRPYFYDYPKNGKAYMKPRRFTEETADALQTTKRCVSEIRKALKTAAFTVDG